MGKEVTGRQGQGSGLQVGISRLGDKDKFQVGQRVPLEFYIRNASDKTLSVLFPLEFYIAGRIAYRLRRQGIHRGSELCGDFGEQRQFFRETLSPGAVLVCRHVGLGIGGEKPCIDPTVGHYSLEQRETICLMGLNDNTLWSTLALTTGRINFEVVDKTAERSELATVRDVPAAAGEEHMEGGRNAADCGRSANSGTTQSDDGLKVRSRKLGGSIRRCVVSSHDETQFNGDATLGEHRAGRPEGRHFTLLDDCFRWKSNEGNRPLEFRPGKHTLLAVFHLRTEGAGELRVESNTVEIKIAERNSPRHIEGRVTDADGKPIAGALLEWGHNSDPPTKRQRTTTDAEGRYRLDYRKYGIGYRLGVSSPGKAPQWKVFYLGLADMPRDGKTIPPAQVDFKLAPEHRIEGIVVDEQGKPIPEVRIRAQTAREFGRGTFGDGNVPSMPIPGEGTFEATTAADGRFRIDGLPAKEVQLSLTAPFRARDAMNYPVDQECRIAMGGSGRPGLVRGRVVDAETGKPVEEFRVVGTSDPRSRLVTSADGRFVWDKKLIEGEYVPDVFLQQGVRPGRGRDENLPARRQRGDGREALSRRHVSRPPGRCPERQADRPRHGNVRDVG